MSRGSRQRSAVADDACIVADGQPPYQTTNHSTRELALRRRKRRARMKKPARRIIYRTGLSENIRFACSLKATLEDRLLWPVKTLWLGDTCWRQRPTKSQFFGRLTPKKGDRRPSAFFASASRRRVSAVSRESRDGRKRNQREK